MRAGTPIDPYTPAKIPYDTVNYLLSVLLSLNLVRYAINIEWLDAGGC